MGPDIANPESSWAEYNRKNRLGASEFASCCPLGHLIVTRVCHTPWLEHVLARFLFLAGDNFDLSNTVASAYKGEPFKLRLLELARDHSVEQFLAAVENRLHNSACWDALPGPYRTSA